MTPKLYKDPEVVLQNVNVNLPENGWLCLEVSTTICETANTSTMFMPLTWRPEHGANSAQQAVNPVQGECLP